MQLCSFASKCRCVRTSQHRASLPTGPAGAVGTVSRAASVSERKRACGQVAWGLQSRPSLPHRTDQGLTQRPWGELSIATLSPTESQSQYSLQGGHRPLVRVMENQPAPDTMGASGHLTPGLGAQGPRRTGMPLGVTEQQEPAASRAEPQRPEHAASLPTDKMHASHTDTISSVCVSPHTCPQGHAHAQDRVHSQAHVCMCACLICALCSARVRTARPSHACVDTAFTAGPLQACTQPHVYVYTQCLHGQAHACEHARTHLCTLRSHCMLCSATREHRPAGRAQRG